MFDHDLPEGAKLRSPSTGSVCHASLVPWGADPKKQKDVIVVNANNDRWQRDHKDFLLWAACESPFSHGVLNRKNKDEILNHATVLDTREIGRGGALWVCKAIRHFKEDTHVPKTWDLLMEHGLTGLQAFIGADILDSTGKPRPGQSHTGLFGYGTPSQLRKIYDEMLGIKEIRNSNAHRGGNFGAAQWGSLKSRKVRKPDGWGGFTERDVPCDVKEYVAQLKEIFEGDPKNVGKD